MKTHVQLSDFAIATLRKLCNGYHLRRRSWDGRSLISFAAQKDRDVTAPVMELIRVGFAVFDTCAPDAVVTTKRGRAYAAHLPPVAFQTPGGVEYARADRAS